MPNLSHLNLGHSFFGVWTFGQYSLCPGKSLESFWSTINQSKTSVVFRMYWDVSSSPLIDARCVVGRACSTKGLGMMSTAHSVLLHMLISGRCTHKSWETRYPPIITCLKRHLQKWQLQSRVREPLEALVANCRYLLRRVRFFPIYIGKIRSFVKSIGQLPIYSYLHWPISD